MVYHIEDRRVQLIGEPFIAPNAALVGLVIVEDTASVWFNVVIRADNDLIRIGAGSNIQDGSVLPGAIEGGGGHLNAPVQRRRYAVR